MALKKREFKPESVCWHLCRCESASKIWAKLKAVLSNDMEQKREQVVKSAACQRFLHLQNIGQFNGNNYTSFQKVNIFSPIRSTIVEKGWSKPSRCAVCGCITHTPSYPYLPSCADQRHFPNVGLGVIKHGGKDSVADLLPSITEFPWVSRNGEWSHELSLHRSSLQLRHVSSLLANQFIASESQRARDHMCSRLVTPKVNNVRVFRSCLASPDRSITIFSYLPTWDGQNDWGFSSLPRGLDNSAMGPKQHHLYSKPECINSQHISFYRNIHHNMVHFTAISTTTCFISLE